MLRSVGAGNAEAESNWYDQDDRDRPRPNKVDDRMKKRERFASVWDAITDGPDQAENLRLRAELMQKIVGVLVDNGWSFHIAAQRCGVTRPRLHDLLDGRISRFTLDALIDIVASIGCRIHFEFEAL